MNNIISKEICEIIYAHMGIYIKTNYFVQSTDFVIFSVCGISQYVRYEVLVNYTASVLLYSFEEYYALGIMSKLKNKLCHICVN